MTPAKLAELEALAKAAPEVAFQGDRESDRYYSAVNPATILELIDEFKKLKFRNQDLERTIGILNSSLYASQAASGDIYREMEAKLKVAEDALEKEGYMRDVDVVKWFFEIMRRHGGSIDFGERGEKFLIRIGPEATYDAACMSTSEAMQDAIATFYKVEGKNGH